MKVIKYIVSVLMLVSLHCSAAVDDGAMIIFRDETKNEIISADPSFTYGSLLNTLMCSPSCDTFTISSDDDGSGAGYYIGNGGAAAIILDPVSSDVKILTGGSLGTDAGEFIVNMDDTYTSPAIIFICSDGSSYTFSYDEGEGAFKLEDDVIMKSLTLSSTGSEKIEDATGAYGPGISVTNTLYVKGNMIDFPELDGVQITNSGGDMVSIHSLNGVSSFLEGVKLVSRSVYKDNDGSTMAGQPRFYSAFTSSPSVGDILVIHDDDSSENDIYYIADISNYPTYITLDRNFAGALSDLSFSIYTDATAIGLDHYMGSASKMYFNLDDTDAGGYPLEDFYMLVGSSAAQPGLRYDAGLTTVAGKWQYSNDGSTWNDIGSGGGPESDPVFTAWSVYTGWPADAAGALTNDGAGNLSWGAGAGYSDLTEFVDQTPWTVFYADGNGDVTELALGADETFLMSNGAAAAPTWESEADPVYAAWMSGPPNVSEFTNDSGFITDLSGFDSDDLAEGVVNLYFPGFTDLFTDYGFTDNSADWDTAYSWGDWSGEDFAVITAGDISNWNDAYSWGDWSGEDFAGITSSDITNWDTAYGWGDHSLAGYLQQDGTTDLTGDWTITSNDILLEAGRIHINYDGDIHDNPTSGIYGPSVAGNWSNWIRFSISADSWEISEDVIVANSIRAGTHLSVGGLLPYSVEGSIGLIDSTDTDSVSITYTNWKDLISVNGLVACNGSGDFSAVTDNSSDWDTAYSWGDWSSEDFAGITSGDISNWDSAYGWGDHSLAGYLTSVAFGDLTDYPADSAGALTNDGAGSLSWVAYLTAEKDPDFDAWLSVPPNISTFTNDSGYITSTDGSGWVDRGTYIEQVTGSDEIAMRQSGSGGAPTLGHVTIPWLSGDSTPTLYVGSDNANNNQNAIFGRSYSNYGLYGLSRSSHGVLGQSSSGVGVEGSSTDNYGVYGNSSNLYGVYGDGGLMGVFGYSATGRGVCGEATSTHGVYGIATTGSAVYGIATTGKSGYFYRNTTTSANPVVDIVQDHATANTGPVLRVQQDSTGPIAEFFDGATSVAQFQDGGHLAMGPGDLSIMETTSTTGDTCIKMYQSSDDGVLDIYQNNSVQHKIHGNGTTVFNELSSDVDFRIESNDDANKFYVDAGNNFIGIGLSTPQADVHIYGTAETSSPYLGASSGATFALEGTDSWISFLSAAADGPSGIAWSEGTSGTTQYDGYIQYSHTAATLQLSANATGTERFLKVASGGIFANLDTAGGGTNYVRWDSGTQEMYCYSSARWEKKDIKPFVVTPELMKSYLNIPLREYNRTNNGSWEIGYIADEAHACIPWMAEPEYLHEKIGNGPGAATKAIKTDRWASVRHDYIPFMNREVIKNHESRLSLVEAQVLELTSLLKALSEDNAELREKVESYEEQFGIIE